ncbi:MAG: galactosyldiacylglycerol synthase [Betaproteobacteria bacterium]|nr:galactosyldiacylglycerol synthase [Betaproteobacteria bacterium]
MIRLFNKETGAVLGSVSEGDLQLLVDQLEEEDSADTDYYVCADAIDLLESNGAGADLLNLLRRALGDAEGIDVSWKRD